NGRICRRVGCGRAQRGDCHRNRASPKYDGGALDIGHLVSGYVCAGASPKLFGTSADGCGCEYAELGAADIVPARVIAPLQERVVESRSVAQYSLDAGPPTAYDRGTFCMDGAGGIGADARRCANGGADRRTVRVGG